MKLFFLFAYKITVLLIAGFLGYRLYNEPSWFNGGALVITMVPFLELFYYRFLAQEGPIVAKAPITMALLGFLIALVLVTTDQDYSAVVPSFVVILGFVLCFKWASEVEFLSPKCKVGHSIATQRLKGQEIYICAGEANAYDWPVYRQFLSKPNGLLLCQSAPTWRSEDVIDGPEAQQLIEELAAQSYPRGGYANVVVDKAGNITRYERLASRRGKKMV